MTHAAVLRDVLASPLPVLVEKPLCTTVADCREVVGRRGAGRALSVAVGVAAHRSIDEARPVTLAEVLREG